MKLNQYQKARIIGARSLQIAMGAPILIKMNKKDYEKVKYNPITIAKMELDEGVLPITIKKTMP